MSSPTPTGLTRPTKGGVGPARGAKAIGRPIDTGKHDAIIEAASRAFFSQGYSQASIEGIAAEAGVSKVTVYNHFGGKPELFQRAVEARCDSIRQRLIVDDWDGPIGERLREFGHAMTEFLMKPEMIQFEIGLAAEAEREPELGANFFAAGPKRLHSALAGLLERARDRGELQFEDSEMAAEHLGAMFKGLTDLQRRMGLPADPDRTARRIKSAVDLFLRANGTGKAG
ncbi:TetR/AcrR family transcriptional regulator [Allopontixanthobacter sp.]|uniref:TetR/AcrR family transcriptional regulator n=1 Tax=Allopontixanthobacter sp. TaxID=2906452 RepID=UPI002ABA5409|nr:TetR/AcrR family transcriptional regulator [Allopontixanthobacter sp.]MDZ4306905.1 TetR/AcrR family transcriptional regulator [Allopontixanthobacter sp.]